MQSADRKHTKSRHERIADRAYLMAERRGFQGGDPVADWVDAEREVDAGLDRPEVDRPEVDRPEVDRPEIDRPEVDRGEIAPLIERFEARVEAAQAKLKALNRRVANLKEETRVRREQDLKRLTTLKDALEKRLVELRGQGEHANEQLKERAEKIWADLGEVLREISARGRGGRK